MWLWISQQVVLSCSGLSLLACPLVVSYYMLCHMVFVHMLCRLCRTTDVTSSHIIIHSVTSSYTVSHHHTQCHIIIHSVTSSYTVSHHRQHVVSVVSYHWMADAVLLILLLFTLLFTWEWYYERKKETYYTVKRDLPTVTLLHPCLCH